MRVPPLVASALFAFLGAGLPVAAQPASGDLRCTTAGGIGLILTGDRALSCVYYRPDGATEFYLGSSRRIGLDIGPSNPVRAAYRVMTSDPSVPGILDGSFGGVGVGLTLGNGIGADALTGGRGAILVPIENTSITGLNISAGLGLLTLHYAGSETRRHRRGY